MRTSEQIDAVATALNKAQTAMKPAKKDAKNPHFKSTYADLAAVIEAIREPFASNGIAWMQDVTADEGGVAVTTRLLHVSGQWLEFGPVIVPLDKSNAHGVGSAVTYGKRYGLAAAAGLATEDDDGNAASQGNGRRAKTAVPEGFANWWLDMEAAAQDGVEALKTAWEASGKDLRAYVAVAKKDEWEALKATAKERDAMKADIDEAMA